MGPSFDVVVVGYGAAGIAAAVTAHDAGASVLVLEKMPRETSGGNTRVSGQAWVSPIDIQAAERHFRALAWEYPVPEDVVSAWARETYENSDWVLARAKETSGRVPRDDGDPLRRGRHGSRPPSPGPYEQRPGTARVCRLRALGTGR